MDKLLITALLSLLPLTNFTHPHEEDPYTTYIQEKLIELGNGNVTSNSSSADMFILKLNFSGNIE